MLGDVEIPFMLQDLGVPVVYNGYSVMGILDEFDQRDSAFQDVDLVERLRVVTVQQGSAVTPAFSRASVASQTDINGNVQTVAANVLRNAHYVAGVLQPPLIEATGQNLDVQSSSVTTAPWSKAPGLTDTPATSCIAGQVARKLTNTNLGSQATLQSNLGVFVAGQTDCAWMIVEPVDALAVTMGIRDITSATWVALFQYTYASQAMVLSAGAGAAGVIPLGFGRYIFWVTSSSGTVGHTRGHFIYPVSTAANTLSAIIHHAQFEPNANAPSSPIITGALIGARAADIDQQLAATSQGYTRQIGSFITDGFKVDRMIQPVGFASNPADIVTGVTALTLSVLRKRIPEAAVPGRSIYNGLPGLKRGAALTVDGKPYTLRDIRRVGDGGLYELHVVTP